MKRLLVSAVVVALMALVSPAWAQPAQQSVHFDAPTCNGSVSLRIHAGGTPVFASTAYADPDTEAYKVAKLAEAICMACSAPVVTLPVTGCAAIDPNNGGVGPFPTTVFDCVNDGFSITKGPGGFDIIISKYPPDPSPNKLNAVQVREDGCEPFNQQGGSAPPNIFLSVCRNGAADGTISVTLDPSPPNPDFSLNTTGLSDAAILGALRTGMAGLGVNAQVVGSSAVSWHPAGHCSGNVLWLRDTQTNQQFGIASTTPFTVVSEGAINNPSVPTLNEWGAILATGLLLILIYWLHRKRMRQQA